MALIPGLCAGMVWVTFVLTVLVAVLDNRSRLVPVHAFSAAVFATLWAIEASA